MNSLRDRQYNYRPNTGDWTFAYKDPKARAAETLSPLEFALRVSSHSFEEATELANRVLAQLMEEPDGASLVAAIEGDPKIFNMEMAALNIAACLYLIRRHPIIPDYVIGVLEQGFLIDIINHVNVGCSDLLLCHLDNIKKLSMAIEREQEYGMEGEVGLAFSNLVINEHELFYSDLPSSYLLLSDFADAEFLNHLRVWSKINND